MSVDTNERGRPTRNYQRMRVDDVNVFVAFSLAQYALSAQIDLKRGWLGKHLVLDYEARPHKHGPT